MNVSKNEYIGVKNFYEPINAPVPSTNTISEIEQSNKQRLEKLMNIVEKLNKHEFTRNDSTKSSTEDEVKTTKNNKEPEEGSSQLEHLFVQWLERFEILWTTNLKFIPISIIILFFALCIANWNQSANTNPCTWKDIFRLDCYVKNCVKTNPNFIKKQLLEQVYGQNIAIDRIVTFIQREHHQQYKTRPVVLHFAGDNGVGKTHTANILSEFYFKFHIGKPIDERRALLYLNGEYFKGRNVQFLTKQLHEHIVKQLRICENSIIFIDDVAKMNWEVFASLEPFFSGIAFYNNEMVITRNAMFILTSDFGNEDMTRDLPLRALVTQIVDIFQLFVPNRPQFHALVTHIPFVSLDDKAIGQIIKRELDKLKNINQLDQLEYSNDVIEYLVKSWWNDRIARSKNGRGITDIIYDVVQPVIHNKLMKNEKLKNITLKIKHGRIC